MIKLTKFIGKGQNRLCFEHPKDSDKCIKIAMNKKYVLFYEIETYKQIKNYIGEYLPKYEEEIVETNLGKGIICQVIKDDSGQYSRSLSNYIKVCNIDDSLKFQLRNFAENLIRHDIFFYDFNLDNFVVQIKNGGKRLYYVDLKSYENYKPLTFLGLEKIITPLARCLMVKRLKRLLLRTNSI